MPRALASGLIILLLLGAAGSPALATQPVCTPTGDGQLRCAITKASDCDAINDYPYHRTLFCPAAFAAAQKMVAQLEKTLGVKSPTRGFFHYYQTLPDPLAAPDDQSQTTTACLDTPAPYSSSRHPVVGAGLPLCHLAAYVTSPGPAPSAAGRSRNPVPATLRGYPEYFSTLYSPEPSFPLTRFRTGSVFDPVVEALGSAGHDAFVADYPSFSTAKIYAPDHFRQNAQYNGISGGGGGGWGAEIAVLGANGKPLTLLAFGGGGGGGMTSARRSSGSAAISALGAGGGGGMQFANAYRFRNRHYNGLGLGAGVGSDETRVQYSYNDYAGSGRPPLPVHQYNPAVIADYQTQLKNLEQQLRNRHKAGKTIVLMGGGGMGAGTEYLMANGQEFEPHALSTQAGFQFSYEYHAPRAPGDLGEPPVLSALYAEQQDLYRLLGDDYQQATRQAYQECGRDYSNYACMCPRTHAIVICLVGHQIGSSETIPSWLQQQHCPAASTSAGTPPSGLTGYQQLLLDNTTGAMGVGSCTSVLLDYFTRLNSPLNAAY